MTTTTNDQTTEAAAASVRNAYTVPDVADLLGVSTGTLYRWRHLDIGPRSFKLGGQVRYRREDVDAYLASTLGEH